MLLKPVSLTSLSIRYIKELSIVFHDLVLLTPSLLKQGFALIPSSLSNCFDGLLKHLIKLLPVLEDRFISYGALLFVPKLILKQFLIITLIQGSLLCTHSLYKMGVSIGSRFTLLGSRKRRLHQLIKNAKDYREWYHYTVAMDRLDGSLKWRKNPNSSLYDQYSVLTRIQELNYMMEAGDTFKLMFFLRGHLKRNQYAMLRPELYNSARSGTKIILEEYLSTVIRAFEFITRDSSNLSFVKLNQFKTDVRRASMMKVDSFHNFHQHVDDRRTEIPIGVRLAFFNEARHAFGRTALLLSGGGNLGFYHIGVVKTLTNNGLLPRIISGASAGSIMASAIGVRTNEELIDVFSGKEFFTNFILPSKKDPKRTKLFQWFDFGHYLPSFLRRIYDPLYNLIKYRGLLMKMDTENLQDQIRGACGDFTFQEAFDRTGRIINISVSPENKYEPPRLLNYLTSPHVVVWSAAAASSAIPGVFDPVPLMVKDPDGTIRPETTLDERWTDGSVEADLPMKQISEMFNVNHFIVSQVNPHAIFFSNVGLGNGFKRYRIANLLMSVGTYLKAQCKAWFTNCIDMILNLKLASPWRIRRGLVQLITQKYVGDIHDISINPWYGELNVFSAIPKMFLNPTLEDWMRIIDVGEKNMWPILKSVRCHCSIEMALEQCVQKMRRKLVLKNEKAKKRQIKELEDMLSPRVGMDSRKQLLNNDQTITRKIMEVISGESPLSVNDNPSPNNNNEMDLHINIQKNKPRKIARMDSFYDASSLVSYSGLAISDPQLQSEESFFSFQDDEDDEDDENDEDENEDGIGFRLSQHDDRNHVNNDNKNNYNQHNKPTHKRDKSGKVYVVRQNSDQPVASQNHAPDLRRSSSSWGPEKNIFKSTSMSRFYYQKQDSKPLSGNELKALVEEDEEEDESGENEKKEYHNNSNNNSRKNKRKKKGPRKYSLAQTFFPHN